MLVEEETGQLVRPASTVPLQKSAEIAILLGNMGKDFSPDSIIQDPLLEGLAIGVKKRMSVKGYFWKD